MLFARSVFSSRFADIFFNVLPVTDVPKMLTEAAFGKTVRGEELSARRRFNYVAMSGAVSLAYALELAGMRGEAISMRVTAATLGTIEFTPDTLEEIAEKSKARHPAAARIVEAAARYAGDKRDMLDEASRSV